jgi:hypothetical protein
MVFYPVFNFGFGLDCDPGNAKFKVVIHGGSPVIKNNGR